MLLHNFFSSSGLIDNLFVLCFWIGRHFTFTGVEAFRKLPPVEHYFIAFYCAADFQFGSTSCDYALVAIILRPPGCTAHRPNRFLLCCRSTPLRGRCPADPLWGCRLRRPSNATAPLRCGLSGKLSPHWDRPHILALLKKLNRGRQSASRK